MNLNSYSVQEKIQLAKLELKHSRARASVLVKIASLISDDLIFVGGRTERDAIIKELRGDNAFLYGIVCNERDELINEILGGARRRGKIRI